MSKLIIARHGETPYNEAGLWTGITDINLSGKGYREVGQAAEIVAKYAIDLALSSVLQRAYNTAKIILAKQLSKPIPLLRTELLNEKDYGIYTAKNKQQVRAEVGDEEFTKIRRSWDYRIEGGESLQDVHARILPLYQNIVVPVLEADKNILVSSDKHPLRAYIKELENIPDDQVGAIELGTAEVRVYDYCAGRFALEARHEIGAVR